MEKTDGTWSHKDLVLKFENEIAANYITYNPTAWDFIRRAEIFDRMFKTMNEQERQERLAKERIEKQLKDLNETPERKPVVGHDGLTWPNTFDPYVWATEFCSRNTASDKSTMIGWFGNAIMRGYHTANREKGKQDIVNSLDDSKTAKLHLEKIVVDGKEKFKLVGFENILRKDQLPKEYIESTPHFYLDQKLVYLDQKLEQIVMNLNPNTIEFRFIIGCNIDHEYIKDFKACGERLASIKKKLKEVKPERFTVKL